MTTSPAWPTSGALAADVMVVGAGPAGLFQVFELGLLGFSSLVVDALPQAGGQLRALYPDKPIYDVPALRQCTGQELVDRLLDQIQPFHTQWALGQQVRSFAAHDPGFEVELSNGQRHRVGALVIAAGVGAFVHRQLDCPALEPARGHSVFTPLPESKPSLKGQRVVVAGSGDEAVDCALAALHGGARSVHLLHRREALDASDAALDRLATSSVQRLVGQVTQAKVSGAQLHALCLSRAGQTDTWHDTDTLIECLGLVPQLGPLADWGLAMHKKQIEVAPHSMATSLPGVHAIGDMAHYAGKRKLLVSAFHEATLSAYAIAERLSGAPVPFEYTTASARLQARLGVISA